MVHRVPSRSVLAVVVCAIAAAACGKQGVVSAGPQEVERLPEALVLGPHVQAGTELVATLDDELATDESVEGQRFTAHVTRALVAPDGSVVVPQGALLQGRVSRVKTGLTPLLVLDFGTVDTTSGPAEIEAKLERTERRIVRRPDPERLSSPSPAPNAPLAPWGGYSYWDTREVLVPAGAKLTLELTRPLVPPGTSVVR